MTDEREYMDKRWIALALLCMAQFVVVLDASIVNVALPTIGRTSSSTRTASPGSSTPTSSPSAASCSSAAGSPTSSAAGGSSSRACSFSPLPRWPAASPSPRASLIAARAVQGLGAALLSPAALSIVTTTFKDGSERNKALGIWGAVAGSGGAAGVLLGGVLTEYVGWEWVLWVNVPIGIGAALLAPRLILESHSDAENRTFDIPGAVTVTAGLSLLVYALVEAPDAGWGSPETLGMIAGALALLGAFVADRAPLARAAGAVQHLPPEDADRGERGRPSDRRVALQHVLLHLALHAERAWLLARSRRGSRTCRLPSRSSSRPGSRPSS